MNRLQMPEPYQIRLVGILILLILTKIVLWLTT